MRREEESVDSDQDVGSLSELFEVRQVQIMNKSRVWLRGIEDKIPMEHARYPVQGVLVNTGTTQLPGASWEEEESDQVPQASRRGGRSWGAGGEEALESCGWKARGQHL